MAEDKRFQFGGRDDVQDGPIFQEDVAHRRIERLSRMVTVLMILLPCIFGLLLYLGYRDLNARMSRTANSGNQEVQKFSEDILAHYNFMDREQGGISMPDGSLAPLMRLSIGTVSGKTQRFSDIREITEMAAEYRRTDQAN